MARIYSPPEGLNPPSLKTENINSYWDDCEKYVSRLKKWAKKNGSGPEAGKSIFFPVADGKAHYIVFSIKPVQLIHVNTGDAYQFQYAHRLTASDIREEIRRSESFRKFFKR